MLHKESNEEFAKRMIARWFRSGRMKIVGVDVARFTSTRKDMIERVMKAINALGGHVMERATRTNPLVYTVTAWIPGLAEKLEEALKDD